MTRKEEIETAAKERCLGSSHTAARKRREFVAGAQWADRTMIERACDWLEENVCNVYNYRGEEITVGFVEQFKTAMEL
ncbi:MAG: hypothetical protein IJT30_03270 [Muribaculaceae bacterium]|nr:hypothetical protein [Muribaculaceae bacterium]